MFIKEIKKDKKVKQTPKQPKIFKEHLYGEGKNNIGFYMLKKDFKVKGVGVFKEGSLCKIYSEPDPENTDFIKVAFKVDKEDINADEMNHYQHYTENGLDIYYYVADIPKGFAEHFLLKTEKIYNLETQICINKHQSIKDGSVYKESFGVKIIKALNEASEFIWDNNGHQVTFGVAIFIILVGAMVNDLKLQWNSDKIIENTFNVPTWAWITGLTIFILPILVHISRLFKPLIKNTKEKYISTKYGKSIDFWSIFEYDGKLDDTPLTNKERKKLIKKQYLYESFLIKEQYDENLILFRTPDDTSSVFGNIGDNTEKENMVITQN